MIQQLNEDLLVFFNSLLDYPLIEKSVFIFADLPIFIIPIFLISYWFYFAYKGDTSSKKKLLYVFYISILSIIINIIIQQFFDFKRPELFLENVGKLILEHVPDSSFPSDHAAMSIGFLASLYIFRFYGFAILVTPLFIYMNMSRMIAGLHWPIDILVGSLIGILVAFGVYKYRESNIFTKLNNLILKIASYMKL